MNQKRVTSARQLAEPANVQSPAERATWEDIRERMAKNRKDKALQDWAAHCAAIEEDSPDLWLVDNVYLMNELARIRGLVWAVPSLGLKAELPLRTVADALWNFEGLLRDILRVNGERQNSWARRGEEEATQPKQGDSGTGPLASLRDAR